MNKALFIAILSATFFSTSIAQTVNLTEFTELGKQASAEAGTSFSIAFETSQDTSGNIVIGNATWGAAEPRDAQSRYITHKDTVSANGYGLIAAIIKRITAFGEVGQMKAKTLNGIATVTARLVVEDLGKGKTAYSFSPQYGIQRLPVIE